MSKTLRIRFWAGVAVLSVALALLVASLLANQSHPDTESTARDLGRRVEARLALLDRYAAEALTSDPDAWLRLEGLPEDMVVYRYREDTLQSWAHQFPLRNDDIRSRTLIQRLGDGRSNAASPLAALTSAVTYVNYGPKWFLARSVEEGNLTVIVGLEVINELKSSPFNGVNPRFRLGDRYSIQPLTGSVGVPVVATFHSKVYDAILEFTKSRMVAKAATDRIVRLYERCDEVWACSEETGETLRSYGYRKPYFVMPKADTFLMKSLTEARLNTGMEAIDGLPYTLSGRQIILASRNLYEPGIISDEPDF